MIKEEGKALNHLIQMEGWIISLPAIFPNTSTTGKQ